MIQIISMYVIHDDLDHILFTCVAHKQNNVGMVKDTDILIEKGTMKQL